ncbi:MAG: hypothetical protein ACTSWW_00920 [Promethearchaeota archaeon]
MYENIEDYQKWLTGVLLSQNLSYKPIKLIVEGSTEEVLIQKYANNCWRSSKIRIVNQKGVDKKKHYDLVFKSTNELFYWFLIDYDKGQNEKQYERTDKKTWFFPDFITEIYSVNEILRAFQEMLASLDLNIQIFFKISELEKALTEIKKKSHLMAKNYPSIRDEDKTIGFEEFLISTSFNSDKVRQKVFGKGYRNYPNYEILTKTKRSPLKDRFKTLFSVNLEKFFIKKENGRPVLHKVFDEKMNAFFKFTNSISSRPRKSIFDLKK